jgi:surface polysaccharide O-acyltransferase-like enzyme
MKAPNERNLSVDLIRTIAMLMVIGLHTQIGFFEHNPILS